MAGFTSYLAHFTENPHQDIIAELHGIPGSRYTSSKTLFSKYLASPSERF